MTPAPARPARIGEIDGLRGIALTLVVIFHLFGHGRVSGGVDVFLTVSGFLLVLSLGRALQTERPLGIVARWGRTFARLAPPATLVLLAVTALSYTVLSPWTREQNLIEVISTALYVENWQLIFSQLAYGAAGPETSPLQHFWSLSVQAQFFFVFPLVVGILTLVIRGRRARVVAFWTLLVVATLASFVYAWRANLADPLAAYFDTGARFWELGVGGLLAGLVLAGWSIPAALKVVAGWAGLAMVISSGFIFDGGLSYPGPAALLPVGGAILVVLSTSGGKGSASPLLTSRPLVTLDRLSYGLYLWHWPILIVFLTIKQRDAIGWRGASVVLAVSVAVTLLTRFLLNAPTAWATSGGGRRPLGFFLVAVVVAVTPAGVLYASSSAASSGVIAVDECAGAASLDPTRPECADAGEGEDPVPALDALRGDDANRAECWSRVDTRDVALCALGEEENYEQRILAVGDSHNNVWVDVYEQIAEARGWRIDVAGRAGCQWVSPDAPVYGQNAEGQAGCAEWRAAISERAASGEYDAILTTASSKSRFTSETPGVSDEEFHTQMILEAWQARPSSDTPILFLRDNPIFPDESLDCIANSSARDAGDCSRPRADALLHTGYDDAVARTENAHTIDLSDLQCGLDRCDMVVGGVVVTRDGAHLTSTYAGTLAPYLDRELARILD